MKANLFMLSLLVIIPLLSLWQRLTRCQWTTVKLAPHRFWKRKNLTQALKGGASKSATEDCDKYFPFRRVRVGRVRNEQLQTNLNQSNSITINQL